MTWFTTGDLDEFTAAAGTFLRTHPVEHTVMLTICESLRESGPHRYGDADPWYGWWQDGSTVTSAFLQTPPHALLLTDVPAEALVSLVDLIREVERVNAERGIAE